MTCLDRKLLGGGTSGAAVGDLGGGGNDRARTRNGSIGLPLVHGLLGGHSGGVGGGQLG